MERPEAARDIVSKAPPKRSLIHDSYTMERPKPVVDWDKTDPATGLSIGCKVACKIIDSLNHQELHLFNAPRRDNPNIKTGELIERYLTQKREWGLVDEVRLVVNDGNGHEGEHDGGTASPIGVGVSIKANEDEMQEPILEMDRTLSTSPIEDTDTDELGLKTSRVWTGRKAARDLRS